MRALWLAVCGAMFTLAACSGPPDTAVAGAVLQPRERVEATNRFGTVGISYVSSQKREIAWGGKHRIVKMAARPAPFLGELGLYDPADCFSLLLPFCRTPRLVVQEAVHDFDSYDQLYTFLREGREVMDWAYTSDGLLVGFSRSPHREQVNVAVRQLTVHGRRPTQLRGARDRNIRLVKR